MRKSSHRVIFVAILLGLISIGQNQVCLAMDKKKTDIRGTITDVTIKDERKNIGWLRVEGTLESDTGFDKAMMRITETTKLERKVKGKSLPASISEFKKGDQVEAGFEGPVAESYPVQANAGWVLLLEKK